jgi:hypothetical protein
MEYVLISESHKDTFNNLLNWYILEGWEPHGYLCVNMNSLITGQDRHMDKTIFSILMQRETEINGDQ